MVRPVDPTSFTPRHVQVADDIRERIKRGDLRPGDSLQSTAHLAEAYGVAVATVRRALAALAAEHLIDTAPGVLATVAETRERKVEKIKAGERVFFRKATGDERRQLGLPEGGAVAVVTGPDGSERVYPAYEVEFVVSGDGE